MEFKGEEFIRNIVIESEKAELEKKVQNLEAQKKESVVKTQPTNQMPQGQPMPTNNLPNSTRNSFVDNESVVVDIKNNFDDELGDIKLEEHNPKDDIKKKYIILSIALSILFILTIIVIRLISDDTKDDTLFNTPTTTQPISQDNILDGSNSEEKYEALINQKANQAIQKELDLGKIAKEEIPLPKVEEEVVEKPKEKSDDVFGMEKKVEQPVKEVLKQEAKEVVPKAKVVKKIIVAPVVQKPKPKITAPKQIVTKTLKGNFIQVGAFTKKPNNSLLNKITKAGYKYTIHKMTIKGTVYNKVLIGSYTTANSKQALAKVKKDLNKPNAYILRLK